MTHRPIGPTRNRRPRQGGFFYVLSLGFVLVLTMTAGSLLMRGISTTNLSERSLRQSQSLQLAESGVDHAAFALRTDSLSLGTTNAGAGSYTIQSTETLNDGSRQVTVRGVSAGDARRVEAIIRLTPASVFQHALFGNNGVTVSGSAETDSYDSRSGLYNDPANKSHNGNIGTNSTASGGIAVSGSIFVDGQMTVGPSAANPESLVTGFNSSFVTGGTSPASNGNDVISMGSTLPMPPVTVPGGLTCNDATINGNETTTLAPGTYCYRNLTIEGNGDLTTNGSGQVTVYLTGVMVAKGNSVVGYAPNPKQMIFLMAPTADATIEQGTMTGSTRFYGALYGPGSTINITGNAQIYGSIIGQTVNVSGSAEVHYDKALEESTVVGGIYTTRIIAWRDLDSQ